MASPAKKIIEEHPIAKNTTKKLVIRAKKQEVSFPLYDRLVQQVEAKKIEEPNNKIWPQISKLDLKNAQVIYLIILHYARLHGNKEEIPYARKVPEGGRGAIYDVESLPLELKLILTECISEITGD